MFVSIFSILLFREFLVVKSLLGYILVEDRWIELVLFFY